MKRKIFNLILCTGLLLFATISCNKDIIKPQNPESVSSLDAGAAGRLEAAALPAVGQNKVAYYAFDVTPAGQGVLPLTTFTDNANIVVVFEGTLWELADTVHYNSGWMTNAYYKHKKQVLNDIQTLRARGIQVLMNVDDAASWGTATPFTTYNGTAYNYTQFASFINTCVNTVGLDGISLDVEHGATDNTNYRNLIKELGKYFGPLSSSPTTKIYTGAFYSGGAPGPIFRETALSQYLNFVMDMGYFQDNTTRFNYWSATLGNSKVMDGMSYDDNSQSSAVTHAQWHPSPDKAGIMVFAANKNKTYTDAIFAALGGSGGAPGIATNPSPVNNSTGIGTTVTLSWMAGSGATSRDVYFGTSSSPALIGNQTATTYNPGTLAANTVYYWRINEKNAAGTTTGTLWTFTTGAAGTGTDITNLSGTISAQYSDSPAGEDITKLIDNTTSTKYLTSHSAAWVRFQATTGAVVVKYTITSANDVPARDPKNWTLQGSNNGTTWTTLNTQTNQTFATRFLKKTYTFTNTTSYTYYRLNVTAVSSGSIMQMSEWELWKN